MDFKMKKKKAKKGAVESSDVIADATAAASGSTPATPGIAAVQKRSRPQTDETDSTVLTEKRKKKKRKVDETAPADSTIVRVATSEACDTDAGAKRQAPPPTTTPAAADNDAAWEHHKDEGHQWSAECWTKAKAKKPKGKKTKTSAKNPPQPQNAPKPKAPLFTNIVPQDHCETPLQAYEDIAPLLDLLIQQEKLLGGKKASRSGLRIYDPYFCTGKMKQHLARLGFDDVYNENVDCYKAWAVAAAAEKSNTKGAPAADPRATNTATNTAMGTAAATHTSTTTVNTTADPKERRETTADKASPTDHGCKGAWSTSSFDVLVTNPPYSGDHILRLLAFCRKSLSDKLVLLNLPNWVYVKYKNLLKDALFVVPTTRYSFDAPGFAGKRATAPCVTMWYVLGAERVLGISGKALDERLGSLGGGGSAAGGVREGGGGGGLFGGVGMFGGGSSFSGSGGGGLFNIAGGSSAPLSPKREEQGGGVVTRDNLPDWLKPKEDPTRKKMSALEREEKRGKNKSGLKSCRVCGQVYGNCKHTRS